MWLTESGAPFYRKEQYLSRLRSCVLKVEAFKTTVQEHDQLTLSDVRTAFYFLATLSTLALAVFALELIAGRMQRKWCTHYSKPFVRSIGIA